MIAFISITNLTGMFVIGMAVIAVCAQLRIHRMAYLRAGTALPAPFDPRSYVHGLLIALCTIAVLRKIWDTQHAGDWSRKQIATGWGITFILGVSFFALFCVLTTWHWFNPTLTWDTKEQVIYKLAITGHVGLATTLIWLGRSALTNRYRSNQIIANTACSATGRTKTSP